MALDVKTRESAAGLNARDGFDVRVERVTDPDRIAREWDELAQTSGNVFATHAWVAAWARIFRRDDALRVYAARSPDGGLLAVLPLALERRRAVRVLRFAAHELSSSPGPAVLPGRRDAALAALRAALREVRHDVFVADAQPVADGLAGLLRGSTRERFPDAVVRLRGLTWEDYLSRRPRKVRAGIRRRERLLADAGVRFRTTGDASELERDLDALVALHLRRWPRSVDASTPAAAAFQREFARLALARGWLRLRVLELDGRMIAGSLGFRLGPRMVAHLLGRDLDLPQLTPGLALFDRVVREAIAEGADELLLGYGLGYKKTYVTDIELLETVATTGSACGALVLAAERLVRRRRRRRAATTTESASAAGV